MTNFEFMEAAERKGKECWDKLQERSHLVRPYPKFSFDLRGRAAGEARGGHSISLNMGFVARYADDMINQTVPHEIVHCWLYAIGDPSHVVNYEQSLSNFMYGGRRTKRSPHGQTFMYTLGTLGCRQERTHSFDVSEVVNGHKYGCGCPGKVFVVSTRKHHIIQSGRSCWCRKCKVNLHKI